MFEDPGRTRVEVAPEQSCSSRIRRTHIARLALRPKNVAYLRCIALLLAVPLVAVATAQSGPRAYRDIHFGDSFSTVAQKVFTDDSFTDLFGRPISEVSTARSPTEQLQWKYGIYVTVGGVLYNAYFDFYDDKLFRVRLQSDTKNASMFDTEVARLRDNLADVITRAHGAPTSTRRIQFFDMQDYHIVWSHRWSTNEDGVEYAVGIGEGSSVYYAGLWIEWAWLRDLHDEDLAKKQQDAVDESVDDF